MLKPLQGVSLQSYWTQGVALGYSLKPFQGIITIYYEDEKIIWFFREAGFLWFLF